MNCINIVVKLTNENFKKINEAYLNQEIIKIDKKEYLIHAIRYEDDTIKATLFLLKKIIKESNE